MSNHSYQPKTNEAVTLRPVVYPEKQDFAEYFADLLVSRIPAGTSVLDIGCGPSLHPALQRIRPHFRQLTGIDPGADVFDNPFLDNAIQSPFEEYDFGNQLYDAAYAYNVLEHLADPTAFATKLSSVLKPGAWFWTLTPHANHPFARLSRFIELLGLKSRYRSFMRRDDGFHGINDYPAYYRLNNVAAIRRFMQEPTLLFDEAEFILLHAGWDSYFPTPMKWIPNIFDNSILKIWPQYRLLLVFGVRVASKSKDSAKLVSE